MHDLEVSLNTKLILNSLRKAHRKSLPTALAISLPYKRSTSDALLICVWVLQSSESTDL